MRAFSWLLLGMAGAAFPASALAQDHLPVRARVQVEMYGYVKLDASYDSRRTAAGDLMFFVLPDGPDGRKPEFNMTARESRLGVNLAVPDFDGIRVTGRIETDFYSGASDHSPTLRLRLAYLDIARGAYALRAGQDWETFITVGPGYAILPRIVNFAYLADAGALGLRRPQVRLTRTFALGEETRLVAQIAAARTIGEDIDGDGQNDGAAAGIPTGQGNLVLVTRGAGGRRTVLGIAGHAGIERVAAHTREPPGGGEPVAVERKDYDTWSVIGSFSQQLSARLTLQGAVWMGENLDTYFGGIGQGINRELRVGIRARGGWAQLVFEPTEALNVNAGYGLDDPNPDDLNPGQRERNEILFASAFLRVAPRVTLAAEYSFLTTSYKDAADAENHRVQSSLIFRF